MCPLQPFNSQDSLGESRLDRHFYKHPSTNHTVFSFWGFWGAAFAHTLMLPPSHPAFLGALLMPVNVSGSFFCSRAMWGVLLGGNLFGWLPWYGPRSPTMAVSPWKLQESGSHHLQG